MPHTCPDSFSSRCSTCKGSLPLLTVMRCSSDHAVLCWPAAHKAAWIRAAHNRTATYQHSLAKLSGDAYGADAKDTHGLLAKTQQLCGMQQRACPHPHKLQLLHNRCGRGLFPPDCCQTTQCSQHQAHPASCTNASPSQARYARVLAHVLIILCVCGDCWAVAKAAILLACWGPAVAETILHCSKLTWHTLLRSTNCKTCCSRLHSCQHTFKEMSCINTMHSVAVVQTCLQQFNGLGQLLPPQQCSQAVAVIC
jgi:hypothetical protein